MPGTTSLLTQQNRSTPFYFFLKWRNIEARTHPKPTLQFDEWRLRYSMPGRREENGSLPARAMSPVDGMGILESLYWRHRFILFAFGLHIFNWDLFWELNAMMISSGWNRLPSADRMAVRNEPFVQSANVSSAGKTPLSRNETILRRNGIVPVSLRGTPSNYDCQATKIGSGTD